MMTMIEKRSRPGRPAVLSEEERRERILDAAEAVFQRTGYAASSMDSIAQESGMSKRTLYKLFKDKEAIFAELIGQFEMSDDLLKCPEDNGSADDAATWLRRLMLQLGLFVMSPRHLSATRLVISESCQSPELARAFYEKCIGRGQVFVREEVVPRCNRLLKDKVDADLLGEILFGAVFGGLQHQALMGCIKSDEERRRDLERRIDFVLKMFTERAVGALGGATLAPEMSLVTAAE